MLKKSKQVLLVLLYLTAIVVFFADFLVFLGLAILKLKYENY